MRLFRGHSGRIGCAALTTVATLVAAPGATAVVARDAHGHFASLAPTQGSNLTSLPAAVAARRASPAAGANTSNGNLDYHGGQVLHSTAPYLIFWDPASVISAGSRALLTRFFTDYSAAGDQPTQVYAVHRQFSDDTGFAGSHKTFSGAQALIDADPFPGNGCPAATATYPTCLTDGQLQAELSSFRAAHGLPTGTTGNAPIYFLVLPPTVNVCAFGTCNSTHPGFCAYHSSFPAGGNNLLYADISMFFNGASAEQDPKRCQADGNAAVQKPNGDIADVALKYLSHEDSETITDPLGSGWWNSINGNENGDNCNSISANPNAFLPTLGGDATAGTLFNQLVNGNPYYIQGEWSNGDVGCVMRPTPGSISPTFTASTGLSVTFDPSASSSSFGFTSESWDFGDGGGGFAQLLDGRLTSVSHTYARPGQYQLTLTLVDHAGNVSSAVRMLSVGNPLAMTGRFSLAHPGTGQPVQFNATGTHDTNGGSIVRYSWNFGDGSTGSGVKVTHVYRRKGSYRVTLTATDSLGVTGALYGNLSVAKAKITKVSAKRNGSIVVLKVKVNAPGKLGLGGRHRRMKHSGTAKFVLQLSASDLVALAVGQHVQFRIHYGFVPRVGKASKGFMTLTV